MLSLILVIACMIGLFKLTGFVLHIVGRLFGVILGVIGWIILAGLAVTLFGAAMAVVPVILVVGVIALIVAVAA